MPMQMIIAKSIEIKEKNSRKTQKEIHKECENEKENFKQEDQANEDNAIKINRKYK
jgi:hypothetical protein